MKHCRFHGVLSGWSRRINANTQSVSSLWKNRHQILSEVSRPADLRAVFLVKREAERS